ncbi:MAG: hypothetical protein U0835_08995 [Isosphaeraceae bacterium]
MSMSHDAPRRRPADGPAGRSLSRLSLRLAWRHAAGLILLSFLAQADPRPAAAQTAPTDPAFEEVRRASVVWERRSGPERRVVDMVCLVPDVATYFEVIAAWDHRHYFPVLIDDVETTLKFLRAFRPAKVVRFPSKVANVPDDQLWARATAAVGRAWVDDATPADRVPRGDSVPVFSGPVPLPPPGVVVSNPKSPALAGAVALAAGRFQPLVRWELPKGFNDELTKEEALNYTLDLQRLIGSGLPKHDQLGDDCDFITLAAEYPYRYILDGHRQAFDDVLGRTGNNARRWAFTGRLMGNPARSVYNAMCSLFLAPGDALLLNTYGETTPPWTDYTMTGAAARLNRVLPTTEVSGNRASLSGWHRTFDPMNRRGLLLINTRGGPTEFGTNGGLGGQTMDIPMTVPAAVLIIHSFSAEKPDNPDTIAGRWMANGAFIYFGSMNEPGLQSFRTPSVVAAFLSENLPVVACVRKSVTEMLGNPWRLVFFGDPLYRIRPLGQDRTRMAEWPAVAAWPAYTEYQVPAETDPDDLRLKWALQTAIYRQQTGVVAQLKTDLAAFLLAIARHRVSPTLRPLYDDLLADTLTQAKRVNELVAQLGLVPPDDRPPNLRRHLETAQAVALQRAMDVADFRQASTLWIDVVRAVGSEGFVKTFTTRVGSMADGPVPQADWRNRLRAALRSKVHPTNTAVLEEELKNVEKKLEAAR